MSLSPGTRLGPYAIVSPLGAGGMGEVYRAKDTRLGRDVAIKILPELFASDPERLARFEREAKTLASLNHPNIAQIYGLEESGELRALVMELVEGEDLSLRIARGAIPLEDALPIARQVADALEAAHDQGIIHRDLKPANIKLRADGTAKVLDFGLARALDPTAISGVDPSNSPTITARATALGMVIGTAAYMAPEQARGRAVDKRADIWAFGVVLYEMLTGRRAFDGEDISITIASILKEDVDWRALPADLPPSLRRLLRRCLEKDPRRRLSSIGDARLELDDAGLADAAPVAIPLAAPVPAPAVATRPTRWPILAGVALAAIVATWAVTRFVAPASAPARADAPLHLSIALPDGDQLTDIDRVPLAVSPDGSLVAYIALHDGKQLLFVRRLGEREPSALTGTEAAYSPFFSPDGQWIAFFAAGSLKKVSVGGAGLQVVCDAAPDARGGDWGADGNIYFAPTNMAGIWRVPAAGGKAVELTRPDHAKGEISHRWPQLLPDRQTLLFSVWTGPGSDERQLVTQPITGGERHVLVPGADAGRLVDNGYLVYTRVGTLFAVPWHPTQADIGGATPIALPEGQRLGNEGASPHVMAGNGTMVYLSGVAGGTAHRLLWVDRSGKTEPLGLPDKDYAAVAISPDGQRAVVHLIEGTETLWIYDFSRRTLTPLVSSGGSSQAPVWTPDGKRILYRGTRHGLRNVYWKSADGTGEEEQLTTKENVSQTPTSVSPDGRWLVFNEVGAVGRGGAGIWRLDLTGDRTPQPLGAGARRAIGGKISPDGRWLAYWSSESGRLEVYVEPFPGPGPREQISTGGGLEPLWSRDGRELFYVDEGGLMAVDIAAGAKFGAGQPRRLFEGRYRPNTNGNTPYDVSADGRRFLRVQQVQPDRVVDRMEIVLHWDEELRRAATAK